MPQQYRVAVVNHPSSPHAAPWSAGTLARVAALGFDTVQLNIAWGARPADEALNLEDILEEPAGVAPQTLELFADPARRPERLAELQERLALARAAGLRTIFHFGAPFNQHAAHGGTPPNCISDPAVLERYERYLDALAVELPVDDLLIYTYDQDAWLCSEFEDCARCAGVPLHERLTPFLDGLVRRWRELRPGGLTWWEPWELSAGQTLRVVESVDTDGFALALHNNFAEVMVSRAVDQHVRNTTRVAAARGIPVIIEGFLGTATEEVEPFIDIQSPLAAYREVRRMVDVRGAVGVKEYYGLDLSWPDPNLHAASLAMTGPELDEAEVLRRLSDGYGDDSTRRIVERIWELTSDAMDLYPWDASWFVREAGRSELDHSLDGAVLRGFCADSPSWRSTRASTFMAVEDLEPHPWLLEDLQIRWESAAERMEQALTLATTLPDGAVEVAPDHFVAFLGELREFARRCRTAALHCQETNLTTDLRAALAREGDEARVARIAARLRRALDADRTNSGSDRLTPLIELLDRDPAEFAGRWFTPSTPEERAGWTDDVLIFPSPIGRFSPTSR